VNTDSTQLPKVPKKSVWNDPKFRSLFFQAVVLAATVAFGISIFHNTSVNLETRGIATGFDFLSTTAGFGIIQHFVPYTEQSSYGQTFLVGLLNTIVVSAIGVFLSTILGVIIGIARLSKNWLVAKLAAVYIEIFRNIPLLLQIFFWYFVVLRNLPSPRQSATFAGSFFLNNRGIYSPSPITQDGFSYIIWAIVLAFVLIFFLKRWADKRQEATGHQFHTFYVGLGILIVLPWVAAAVTGFPLTWDTPSLQGFNFKGGMVIIPEFTALLLSLVIYTASFMAETVRAGIESVAHGQTEAAHALGLRPNFTLRLVILPQALRVIIPPMTSEFLNLTKNSSLATAIAYPDLVAVFAGTTLNQTGQAIEIIAMTMAVYLSISLLISAVMNWYNASVALVER